MPLGHIIRQLTISADALGLLVPVADSSLTLE